MKWCGAVLFAEVGRRKLEDERCEAYRNAANFSRERSYLLSNSKVLRGRPPAVLHDFKLDALTFIQRTQSSPLNCRDVYEYIFAAALRLNKPISLLRVEPLNSALSHYLLRWNLDDATQ